MTISAPMTPPIMPPAPELLSSTGAGAPPLTNDWSEVYTGPTTLLLDG
jgi:hypothetical protein